MIDLSPDRIAELIGAQITAHGGDGAASPTDRPRRAAIDSRQIGAGDLFFGLAGVSQAGGRFVAMTSPST